MVRACINKHNSLFVHYPCTQIVDNDLHKDGLWQRVFTDIRRGGPPDHNTLIRFRALSTDGGVDAQRTSYWLDHMFAHNTHTAYCSEIGSNIHCMAVLLVCVGDGVWCTYVCMSLVHTLHIVPSVACIHGHASPLQRKHTPIIPSSG